MSVKTAENRFVAAHLVAGTVVRLLLALLALMLFMPVAAYAQGVATISQTNANTGTFTTTGGIGGTIAITNRNNATAASGIGTTSMAASTNFPSTWYGSIPVTATDFRSFEINNTIVALTGSYRVTITFATTVKDPVLMFANIDSGQFDFANTTTATGGAPTLTRLSGNTVFAVTGTTVNPTTANAVNAGCQDNSAGNPAGRCGAVQFTGNYNSITYVVTDTNTATGSGDGHGIALFIPAQPDLAVTKADSISTMMSGNSTVYTVVVTNNGPDTVTGAVLTDPSATGLLKTAVACASTPGVCTSGTTPTISQLESGYTLPAIPAGGTYRLSITATATATSGSVTNTATVAPPSGGLDTVSGNNSASDTNSVTTRTAGTPPTLVCPTTTTIFDWDTVSWTAGATSGSYAVTAIGTININIAITGGVFLNLAAYGGQAPVRQNVMTGGFTPAQFSLFQATNFTSTAGVATTTYTLPTAVPGAQFRVFDIDFNAGQYADRITVTGTFNGSPVTPTLTNGVTNYVIGNTAYGDGASGDTSADGNIVVTFTSPVDTIIVQYGNHSASPADPGQQAITLHDITFCRPNANITMVKSSSVVSDPTSGTTNPKAIPGARIRYCLLTTNNGSGTATSATITDPLPSTSTYVPGTLRSGTTCATATTVEDDNNTGADESDPFGASFAGTTVSAVAPTLGVNATMAITFDVLIN